MGVVARCLLFLLTLGLAAVSVTAADPPIGKPAPEYASPRATYRTYIEAVRQNDLAAAQRCWVIDDGNRSGALDAIVGLWVSMRQINQIAEKKFGARDLDGALKGWRRDDLTDSALDRTAKRLGRADVRVRGETAELMIRWKDGDGGRSPAFEYREEPTYFRKTDTGWKIDANKMTGVTHGATFFEDNTWGRMFRDQVTIMQQAIKRMEKGELGSVKELRAFVDERIEAMKKEYENEGKKGGLKDK